MTDDESWVAFLAAEACQSHKPGCAAHNSGTPEPVEDPWAYWGAYSLQGPYEGSGACRDGSAVANGWEALQESRLGHHRPLHFHCPSRAQVR
jgi:hypothetical protein